MNGVGVAFILFFPPQNQILPVYIGYFVVSLSYGIISGNCKYNERLEVMQVELLKTSELFRHYSLHKGEPCKLLKLNCLN